MEGLEDLCELVPVFYCPVWKLQADADEVVKEARIEAHVANQGVLSGILEDDIRLGKTLLKRLRVAIISSLWYLNLAIQAIVSFDPVSVLEDWQSIVEKLIIVLKVVGPGQARFPWDLLNI